MKKIKSLALAIGLMAIATGAFSQTVNVNTATAKEITRINGIGSVKAAAIIALCQTNKPCEKTADLLKVKGIGKKTLAKIAPFIVFESETPKK